LDKKFSFFLSLLIILLSVDCGLRRTWQRTTFIYFDTVCEVELLGYPAEFKKAQDEIRRIFSDIERLFSPGSSDFSDPLALLLYQGAYQVYYDSDGCFDITVGPLTKIWGFWDKSFRLPSKKEIGVCLKSVGMEKLKGIAGSPQLSSPGVLDWGGIAKGFGIDLAYQALLSIGIKRGFLNSGGDLICWGKNPKNTDWQVAVEHPRKSVYLGILSISDRAAATSGDYQRFFIKNGVRYHHVLNPKTGYPARGKQSVTVVGPQAVLCDALSTALFVSPHPEKILNFYPDYGAIIVDNEGRLSLFGKVYSFRLF